VNLCTLFPSSDSLSRRQFNRLLAASGLGMLASGMARGDEPASPPKLKLGFDNFAVRSQGWKGPELIDYAARLNVDSLLISDLAALGGLDDAHLTDLRKRAADHGIGLNVGTWSVCPTSTLFKKDWGTASEHLALGIRSPTAASMHASTILWKSSSPRAPRPSTVASASPRKTTPATCTRWN